MIMSLQIIGLESKKVYAVGSRADCFRKLHKQYPSTKIDPFTNRRQDVLPIYPEKLIIVRRKK